MNYEKMNAYLDIVPPEIRDAVSGLHDDKHWAVYIALLENGETNFSSIKEEFDLESTQVIRILRDLGDAGLVAQYTDDLGEVKSRARSFYRVTPIGQDFIEALMKQFLPQRSEGSEYGTYGVDGRASSDTSFNRFDSSLMDCNGMSSLPTITTADTSYSEGWRDHRYQ